MVEFGRNFQLWNYSPNSTTVRFKCGQGLRKLQEVSFEVEEGGDESYDGTKEAMVKRGVEEVGLWWSRRW